MPPEAIPAVVERIPALLREVARNEILPRFGALGAGDVRTKSHPWDVVTVADLAAERRLEQALVEALPGSVVVGEEAAESDPGILAMLAGRAPAWLVDPLDGTRNFVEGKPAFAVIVALCQAGETVAGWILDPIHDVLVSATAGGGAWREDASGIRPLCLTRTGGLATLAGSLSGRAADRLRAAAASSALPPLGRIHRIGSVGCEYLALACGDLDFAAYGRLKPWDHAAGVLIHAEAGGFGRLRGSIAAYQPAPAIVDATLLLAPDEAIWHTLDRLLG
jgi:fructose-1,6-bisphosphatase/inositol monophosphatase family enzyme